MNKLGALEGLLFVVGEEGITAGELMNILDITNEQILSLIDNLKKKYESDESGIDLIKFGDYYKLITKKEHYEFYEKLLKNEQNSFLSQAAIETLVIIAYNEPVMRIDIDEARGIYSAPMIRKLITKGFVKECGKADLPGRPNLYKTTDLFLDYFGLSSINDLPKIDICEEDPKDYNLFESKDMKEV